MSEDGEDSDADDHLPETGDDAEPDPEADLSERTTDAGDADLPDRTTDAGDADLPDRTTDADDADLPDRTPDAGDADDADALSSSGEQDRLPQIDRETGDDSPVGERSGPADAESASSEAAETTSEESPATPADEADGTEESPEAEEPGKRDAGATAPDASTTSTEASAEDTTGRRTSTDEGDVRDRPRREGASGDDDTATAAGPGTDPEAEPGTDPEAEPGTDAGTESSDESTSSTPSTPLDGLTGLSGGDADERRAEDFEEGDLPPRDLDRAFSILEEAFTSDAFGGQQLDQLLTVFEGAMTGDGDTDPEAVMELIAMLEQLIVEPDDLTEVDVGGFLSIFEEAISGSTGVSEEDIADVFDILEEGLRDPTSIEPEDVERFRTSVESAIMDITDPSSGGFGGLFALPGLFGEEAVRADESGDDAVDMFRIARIAAGMTQRATGYSMETGVRTGTRMAYAAANSQSPAELLTNARAIALDELQRAGIDIGDDQQDWLDTHEDELVHPRPVTREALQERGEALLRESAEIGVEESIHPSYPMILDELASDEARILRLLATDGPQGVVDVYERKYIPFTLTLVARNLTMLGADAGCRDKGRTPIHVENLQRLGLVAVRDTPIDDLKRYQVIQAQPHVEAARDSVKRARTRYKSIELTDFGMEFCRVCFPFPVTDETAHDTFRSAGSE